MMVTASATEWDVLQSRAFDQLTESIDSGQRAIAAAAPTGFGKTRLATWLINWACDRGWKWVFYTHRKLLFSQTHERFTEAGLQYGVRASGHYDEMALFRPGQLAMLPSERSAIQKKRRSLHRADLVIVDEAHANKTGFAEETIKHHLDEGATVIGLTATPVGIGHLYTKLIHLCRNSELRSVGGILTAHVYAPDEIDVSDVKKVGSDGEFSQKELGKRFAVQQVVGRVYEWWLKLNPRALPALLFAPGVQESMWFVDHLNVRGVRAAHIDGTDCYLGEKDEDGERIVYASSQEKRDQIKAMSESGEIQIVCNRFVMREGVDWPHLYHGIFATAFGTEEGWVQSVGRILRSYPKYDHVLITDHGGNVWRPSLGSPNADREWLLTDTNKTRAGEAKKKREEGDEKEPVNCPECRRPIKWEVWSASRSCPFCHHKFSRSTRWVQQTNGNLKRAYGNTVKVKRKLADPQKAWNSLYWPSSKSKRPRSSSFHQLRARFHKQYPNYYMDVRGEYVTVLDRESGERTRLQLVPEPDSDLWREEVRQVPRKELQ